MDYVHFAIGQPLRNSARGPELNPVKSQNCAVSVDPARPVDVATINCRWCATESGSFCVSEDGCVIAGKVS
jgi:hypothetical protein